MVREKKQGRNITCFIESEVYTRLEKFCKDSGMTKTRAVEKALTAFMNDYYIRLEKLESIVDLKK